MAHAHSIPFAIGSYLVHGKLMPAHVSGDNLKNSLVSGLSRRVMLQCDEDFSARFPGQCLQQILVSLSDGQRYNSGVLSAKGDPSNPLSIEELPNKFRDLTVPSLGDRSHRISEMVNNFEKYRAVDLIDLL